MYLTKGLVADRILAPHKELQFNHFLIELFRNAWDVRDIPKNSFKDFLLNSFFGHSIKFKNDLLVDDSTYRAYVLKKILTDDFVYSIRDILIYHEDFGKDALNDIEEYSKGTLTFFSYSDGNIQVAREQNSFGRVRSGRYYGASPWHINKSKHSSLQIDPGDASPDAIADILSDLSIYYRMMGGSGLDFSIEGVKQSKRAKV